MAAVPMMSWFGTPEFGQGIAWHLDLAILVVGAMVAVKERRTRRLLAWACGLSIAAVTATMVHTDKDWFLAPFLFYDSLAFYGIFGAAVLLAVIARGPGMLVVVVLGFALLVIVISGNRTAILLAATAPFVATACWWLTKYVSHAARPVIALVALIAPVLVTAVIVFSNLVANEASLWSRDLHLTVARQALIHNPFDLIWGNGWGSYAERQLAYLPVGEFDVVGAGGSGPEWDAARGQIHFQSHNFLVEALLSGGLVAMALTWAMVAALPLFLSAKAYYSWRNLGDRRCEPVRGVGAGRRGGRFHRACVRITGRPDRARPRICVGETLARGRTVACRGDAGRHRDRHHKRRHYHGARGA